MESEIKSEKYNKEIPVQLEYMEQRFCREVLILPETLCLYD